MPATVCITSLLVNASKDTFYDIFILHRPEYDFSHSSLLRLPRIYGNCKITLRAVSDAYRDAYEVRGITVETYFRLLAPRIIPEYDKILYSDVDVIFREDLSRFYQLDLTNYYWGGVDNCSELRPGVRQHLKEIRLDWKNGYYYAGNIIMNSALLREHHMDEKFKELSSRNYPQQDMDILNIACNRRIKPLGLSFCMTTQLYDLILNRQADMERIYGSEEVHHSLCSGIVHYNGQKPWMGICPNMDIWWHYYRSSICFDQNFAHDFWIVQRDQLIGLPFSKRLKLLLRYPLDRRNKKR